MNFFENATSRDLCEIESKKDFVVVLWPQRVEKWNTVLRNNKKHDGLINYLKAFMQFFLFNISKKINLLMYALFKLITVIMYY